MAMSTSERAALAGRARVAKQTPEERREQMRKVRRSAHVKAIVADWPELTPEQKSALRAVVNGGAQR